jgi:hypothetical protein
MSMPSFMRSPPMFYVLFSILFRCCSHLSYQRRGENCSPEPLEETTPPQKTSAVIMTWWVACWAVRGMHTINHIIDYSLVLFIHRITHLFLVNCSNRGLMQCLLFRSTNEVNQSFKRGSIVGKTRLFPLLWTNKRLSLAASLQVRNSSNLLAINGHQNTFISRNIDGYKPCKARKRRIQFSNWIYDGLHQQF